MLKRIRNYNDVAYATGEVVMETIKEVGAPAKPLDHRPGPVHVRCGEKADKQSDVVMLLPDGLEDPQNNVKITLSRDPGFFEVKTNNPNNATFKSEIIRSNNSVLTRWMADNGYTGLDVIQIDHSFDKKNPGNKNLLEFFRKMLYWRFKTNLGGDRIYVAVWTSASGERTCTTTFMNLEMAKKFLPWYTMDMDIMRRMPLQKAGVYLAQCTSATHGWEVTFGNKVKYPDMKKAVCALDVESVRKSQIVNYVHDGKIEWKKLMDVIETNSDGIVIMFVDWDEKTMLKVVSVRAPGVKGALVFVDRGSYIEAAKRVGKKPVVIDIWGKEHDVRDVDIVFMKSSFKWIKAIDTEELFHEYLERLEQYGHQLYVCKEQHLRKRPLPYQQNQVAEPSAEDEKTLVDYAVNYVNKENSVAGAIKLLDSKAERYVASMMPEYLKEGTVRENINVRHRVHMRDCLTGKIPDLITYPFALPDMVNVCMHLMGVEDKFMLKPGCVTFNNKDVPYGSHLFVTRNPAPGMNVLEMVNVEIKGLARGFFITEALYFNSQDLAMRTLSMDFDGDTVGVACLDNPIAKAFWDGIAAAKANHNYHCVYFDNASQKTPYSRDAMLNSILLAESSEVGLVIYTLTKVRDYRYDAVAATLLEAYSTQCIDAAKNGENQDVQLTKQRCHTIMEDAQKKCIAAPMHIFFKKELPPVTEVDDLEKSVLACMPKYKDGTPKYRSRANYIGRYVHNVRYSCSWNLEFDKWNIPDWVDSRKKDADPSWKKFCRKSPVNVPNLLLFTDMKTFNASQFGQVVNEIKKEMANSDRHMAIKNVRDLIPMRIEELVNYARANKKGAENFDEQDLLSALVMALYGRDFSSLLSKAKTMLRPISDAKKVFWMMFGGMVTKNVRDNLKGQVDIEIEAEPVEEEQPEIAIEEAYDAGFEEWVASRTAADIPDCSDDEDSFGYYEE